MPQLEFFLVAQSLSIDQRTDRLSVFEVLDVLQPRRFPAFVPRLFGVSAWLLTEDDHGKDFQVTLRTRGPKIEQNDFPQNFTAEGLGQRMVHQVVGLPVFEAGCLEFELLINGERAASHRIRIEQADPEAPPDGSLVYAKATSKDTKKTE